MGLKLEDPIAIARGILNDRTPDYRYDTDDLLEYGNGALRALCVAAPQLLYTEGELACESGKALQSVSFDDAHALVSVLRIKDGNAVTKADKAELDAFMPGWIAATSGAAVNWLANGDDPIRFFVYPPAPAGQVLIVMYVRIPGPYTASQDTGLPITITEAIADYIVAMAEARDDEHVVSGRSAQFIQQFAARLGVKPQA